MENDDGRPFPHGATLKKFEGTIYKIGDMEFRPTKIRREQLQSMGVSRREAVFDAENVQTGEPVIMEIWAESDPTPYLGPCGSVEGYRSFGLRGFWEEVQRCRQCSSSLGFTPAYITHAELQQDDRYERPGGYLGIIVLSKNPNRTVSARDAIIASALGVEDLKRLAKRCEEMFREFRGRGLSLAINVWQMEYEPETMKPYVFEPHSFRVRKRKPGQPPLSKLSEMADIETLFDISEADVRKKVFGNISWVRRRPRRRARF